jgi:DNA topoisomerase VI subunit B
LTTSLCCRALASRIVKELGPDFWEGMAPSELDHLKTVRLSNLLKSVSIFKPPDGDCLSPAGEYNLRLGIMKEIHPAVSGGTSLWSPCLVCVCRHVLSLSSTWRQ